ncbi:MAG TPA: phosphatidylserine/phosphatidylglycerophosphate/cardiolipin synthase family protein [Caulobacteraceae bacterium]
MPKYTLLVGSDEFMAEARADMAKARRRLMVQAMTFEGDQAGLGVGRAIMASPASDRRVLVDDYTRFVISDRFVFSPHNLFDPDFRAEVRATRGMFDAMSQMGVRVRVTNPAGPFLWGFPFRNHKKLIVADNTAFIGGINFSDHNFAWLDLMLRIEDADISDLLAADFESTWQGQGRSWNAERGDIALFGLDGRDNHARFGQIIAAVEAAKSEIAVVSPYLTFPFTGALARAAARGVEVTVVTPAANNKPMVRDYLLRTAARDGLRALQTPAMIHLKGMLIDGRALILGSSNFDFVSYWVEEELVAIISNPALIADFRARVLEPLIAEALPAGAMQPSKARGRRAAALLGAAGFVLGRGLPARRTSVPWPQ